MRQVMNAPRPGKALLVLDLDYSLSSTNHRGTATDPSHC